MELYDKKYVYFEWDDKLEGKKGFVATDILYIKKQVNGCTDTALIYHSSSNTQPFTQGYYNYSFAYYDPNYEVKKAYNEGKKVQYKYKGIDWKDWVLEKAPSDVCFEECEWRVKPEQYIDYDIGVIDDEGYVRFQIYDFMNIFGERLFMGVTLPCETNCKIQVKDEWHYVKDGDLPKDDIKLAIIEIDDCGYLLCNYRNGFWYDANSSATCAEWITNNIISWKEIIPPKESE